MRIRYDEEDLKVKYVSLHTLDAPAPPLDRLVVVTPPFPKQQLVEKLRGKGVDGRLTQPARRLFQCHASMSLRPASMMTSFSHSPGRNRGVSWP